MSAARFITPDKVAAIRRSLLDRGFVVIELAEEEQVEPVMADLAKYRIKARFSSRLERTVEFDAARDAARDTVHVFLGDLDKTDPRHIDIGDVRPNSPSSLRCVFDHRGFILGVMLNGGWLELERGTISPPDKVVFADIDHDVKVIAILMKIGWSDKSQWRDFIGQRISEWSMIEPMPGRGIIVRFLESGGDA